MNTPFHARRISLKRRVVYVELAWNGIDSPVDILIEHRHGGEGPLRRQASRRNRQRVVEQLLLQIELAESEVVRAITRGRIGALHRKYVFHIVDRKILPGRPTRANVERKAGNSHELVEVPEYRGLQRPAVGESPRLAAAWIAQELGRIGCGRHDPKAIEFGAKSPPVLGQRMLDEVKLPPRAFEVEFVGIGGR